MRATLALALLLLHAAGPAAHPGVSSTTVTAAERAVLVATVQARCDACAWEVEGREAVVLRLSVDGKYSQHVPLVRPGDARYEVLLGTVEPGTHTVTIEVDPELTAPALRTDGSVSVRVAGVRQHTASDPEYAALAHAPFVHARPNTIGRFTDVPVFSWYETEPTARGTRYRYSYIFTHEDGGTPTDRLMATWGRSTDIEYLYSVELGRDGAILAEDLQGPEHEILPYRGAKLGTHPQLWIVTDNNMVLDRGTTAVRYAPAPVPFALVDVSREAVMDAHPWLYDVASRELRREGRIVPDAPPRQGVIPDPRRYVYIEACGEAGVTALAFAVQADGVWHASDRGVPEYRIVRAGCFRAAVPLPSGISLGSAQALRVQAFERPYRPGAGQPVSERPAARLTRINSVFTLDDEYRPGTSRLSWRGEASLPPGAPPLEFPLR